MDIEIKANHDASTRTKNRIREHGNTFDAEVFGTHRGLDGRKSVLLTAPDGWHGWLPMDEIEVLFFCGLEVVKTENVTVTEDDDDERYRQFMLATGGI